MRKENSTNAINEKIAKQFCNAAKTLALFSGRWKLSILFRLLDDEANYAAFKILLPEISDRTLAKQLNELISDGVITKEKNKTSSIYSITPYGLSLQPILLALSQFKNHS